MREETDNRADIKVHSHGIDMSRFADDIVTAEESKEKVTGSGGSK